MTATTSKKTTDPAQAANPALTPEALQQSFKAMLRPTLPWSAPLLVSGLVANYVMQVGMYGAQSIARDMLENSFKS